ncbi:MAG: hypothetical protein V2A63_03455 [Patescibacteria group bacterium]
MQKIFSIILSLVVVSSGITLGAKFAEARTYRNGGTYYIQRGYYKPSTGKYVMPHLKTRPDNYKWNNKNYRW